jgi:hypothetical protein
LGQKNGGVVAEEILSADPSAAGPSLARLRKFRADLTGLRSPENRGFVVFWSLCILTAASASVGFGLEASVKGPAQVPSPPTLSISFPPGSPAPRSLSIDSFLEQIHGQPELILTMTGVFASHQTHSGWSVDARGFTGYICPGQPGVKTARIPGEGAQESYLYGDSAVPAVSGADFLTVKLCWNSGAPLVTSGAYISATLPAVLAPKGQAGTVTRFLVLSDPSLSSYISAGGIPPAVASGQGWAWASDISDALDSQARFDIPVIASSLPGVQHDNRLALYSGIFFGIAGGGFVSLPPALLDALDRRRTRKKAREASEQRSRSEDEPGSDNGN